jgi:hypothetical protein
MGKVARALVAIVALIVAACDRDTDRRRLVGVWTSVGPAYSGFSADTMIFSADGTIENVTHEYELKGRWRGSRLLRWDTVSRRRSVDTGSWQLTEGDRGATLLCMTDPRRRDTGCSTVTITDSLLLYTLGGTPIVTFTRLRQ